MKPYKKMRAMIDGEMVDIDACLWMNHAHVFLDGKRRHVSMYLDRNFKKYAKLPFYSYLMPYDELFMAGRFDIPGVPNYYRLG